MSKKTMQPHEIRERLLPKTKIEIVYAGGTISSLATPAGYRVGGTVIDLVGRLQQRLPGFSDRFQLGTPRVAYKGLSENMDTGYQRQILKSVKQSLKSNPDAVIITHGTDSMEQNARYLQRELSAQLKHKKTKIILTGANDDISDPQTDAWDNLQYSFTSSQALVPAGVYVAFHGHLIPADKVAKLPYNPGVESTFIANDSSEYAQALQTQQSREVHLINGIIDQYGAIDTSATVSYEVNVIRANHDAFLQYVDQNAIKAVLLTLYHSGTANTESPSQSVAKLTQQLRQRGIVVFGVTENSEPVDLHSYETSVKLREAGVIPLYDMPAAVARIKLAAVVTKSNNRITIIDEMLTNRAGEITEGEIKPEDINQLRSLYS